jgi:hypothetical protein
MSRQSRWPCATEPPPRAVPKVNRAPSSSSSEAASPVPAATGHGIFSAPHRRASPDRWTPRRPLRRHPHPHFCPIGTVSPPADRRCRHEGSLVSAPPPRCPKWVPHLTGHLFDPRPHLTAPLLTGSGHRRRPAPWIEPLPCFPHCKWATSPWVARPFGWASQRWHKREQYPFLISFVFIQIKFK